MNESFALSAFDCDEPCVLPTVLTCVVVIIVIIVVVDTASLEIAVAVAVAVAVNMMMFSNPCIGGEFGRSILCSFYMNE